MKTDKPISLNNIEDLANYKSRFSNGPDDIADTASLTSAFDEDMKAVINDQIDVSNLPIAEEDRLDDQAMPSFTYKISLLNDCRSFSSKEFSFSNRIQNTLTTGKTNEQLLEIIKLKDTYCDSNKMPLVQVIEYDLPDELILTDRVENILKIGDIPPLNYGKWYYKNKDIDEAYETNSSGHVLKGLTRIYTRMDVHSSKLDIVLLDPHHLLATTRFDKYELIKSYGACISKLKPIY